jgi:alpha-beta hydrolase superfamily lysophospholipase
MPTRRRGSLLLTLALASCAIPKPGPFYATPANPAAPHGTLLLATPLSPAIPGTAAYRVVYNSEAENGTIIPVSGVIFIPDAPPPPGGRNIVAWAHPTTGTAPGCAPSLQPTAAIADAIPGLPSFLAAGDIVAATDYEGLGEPGTHPYLIGKAEGQNIIDSVLAAQTLPAASPSGKYVVWGHSQGGQAALFAGQIAHAYAPQLNLVGIAAAAPVTDLDGELNEPNTGTTGHLFAAYVDTTWSKTYHVPLTSIVTPQAVPALTNTATKCLNTLPDAISALHAASAVSDNFHNHPPQSTPPWPDLFDENSPGNAPPGAPLLILQGTADPTVEPHWTRSFVTKICARHETLDYQELKGVNHLSVAYKSLPMVTPWITARFTNARPRDNCPAG